MKTIYNIFSQIADMIAQLDSKKVLALRASSELQERFDLLVEKSKTSTISSSEKDELDHFIVLERLFRLAKIRAEE